VAKRKKDRTDELLSELVKGKSPEEILGEGGVLKQLTKRLVENAPHGPQDAFACLHISHYQTSDPHGTRGSSEKRVYSTYPPVLVAE
jgi:hypothetical protein